MVLKTQTPGPSDLNEGGGNAGEVLEISAFLQLVLILAKVWECHSKEFW